MSQVKTFSSDSNDYYSNNDKMVIAIMAVNKAYNIIFHNNNIGNGFDINNSDNDNDNVNTNENKLSYI